MYHPCPHCSSTDTTYKAKAGKWECNACEERFEGPALLALSIKDSSGLSAKAAQPRRIFFSYGHDANRELVDRFKADLEKRGHQVWIDYKEIGSWDDWRGAITRGIHDSQMAVAFLSIHSTRDPGVCRNEIAMALHHFGMVYPVMVEAVPRESIPATISHLQWPDLTQWRELREAPDPQGYERFYQEKLLEIISRVEGEATRFASESEVLRRVLQPSDFDSKFAQHLGGFIGREWCFEAFETWLNHQPDSRVFWVKAGPGFGKTALAVQIASRFRGAVVGCWFCDHQSAELSDPKRAVTTLAFQLALRWDDYRARLLPRLGLHAGSREEQIREALETLAKKNLRDLFELLLAGPMAGLIWREHKLVILMDALDEVSREKEGRNDLAGLISQEFLELPKWISFVVMSRSDSLVSGHLQRFKPFEIAAEDARNAADLRSYVMERILSRTEFSSLKAPEKERLAKLLVERSDGMVLYLRMVHEGLAEGTLEAGQLEGMQSGLAGLHARYYAGFERRFGVDGYAKGVQPLVRLLLAAPGPLPLELAAEVLGVGKEEVFRMRTLLGSYVADRPAGMSLFHKTLSDWLGSEVAGLFYTDSAPAAQALGERLWLYFEERKENAHGVIELLRWEVQVLEWLPKLLGAIGRANDAEAMTAIADWLFERFHNDAAEFLCRSAIERSEKILGAEHPDTLSIVVLLGNLLRFKFDYQNAEGLYRRVLEGWEKALGAKHPKTLSCVHSLGVLLLDKGDYAEAELLFRRALQEREKALGPEHAATLRSLDNLGQLLIVKGDFTEAELLCRRALMGREKALGAEHRDTLRSVSGLGRLLFRKGDNKKAEFLYCRALKGREKVLGVEHPDTLTSVQKLGSLLHTKGDFAGAELLYRRALEGRGKVLGVEHPDTLISANKLGSLLHTKGDFAGAELLYRRALKGSEKALGAEHPETLVNLYSLANLLRDKRDYEGAAGLYHRALEGANKVFGAEHPDTLSIISSLGSLHLAKRDQKGAELLYRRALEGREKALGAEHSSTLKSAKRLASTLKINGKAHEAAVLLRNRYSLSEACADAVRYNLACYEYLSGNTVEAKRLIAEHLRLHPEKKNQALADKDLATINGYIASL